MPKRKWKVDFRVMSEFVCTHKGCPKKIKQNVVHKKATQKSFLCFGHFMQKRMSDRAAADAARAAGRSK